VRVFFVRHGCRPWNKQQSVAGGGVVDTRGEPVGVPRLFPFDLQPSERSLCVAHAVQLSRRRRDTL